MEKLATEIGSFVEKSFDEYRKDLSSFDIERILKMTFDVMPRIRPWIQELTA